MANIELRNGLKFYSIWFKGLVEILSMKDEDIPEDEMEVKITPPEGHTWHERWNIQHTKWGFERDEYYLPNLKDKN